MTTPRQRCIASRSSRWPWQEQRSHLALLEQLKAHRVAATSHLEDSRVHGRSHVLAPLVATTTMTSTIATTTMPTMATTTVLTSALANGATATAPPETMRVKEHKVVAANTTS